jgi:hypothetical protein
MKYYKVILLLLIVPVFLSGGIKKNKATNKISKNIWTDSMISVGFSVADTELRIDDISIV